MPVESFRAREPITVTVETIRERFFVFVDGQSTCESLVMALSKKGLEPYPSDRPDVFSLEMPAPQPEDPLV